MKKIRFIIKQLFYTLLYLSRIREFRRPKLQYGKHKGEKAYVCGNGPSIEKVCEAFCNGHFGSANFFMVNFSPTTDAFYKIKPNHYFISDYGFSMPEHPLAKRIRDMYIRLQNSVDWELTIYIARNNYKECKELVEYSKITNPHIKFIFLYKRHCDKLSTVFRNKLYKTGFFMPMESTVVNTALWVAILEGYDEIELYGVETNQFKDLEVDDDNSLFIVEKHYYGKERARVILDKTAEKTKIHIFLATICGMLASYYRLSLFAEYMGAKVYNCTPNSMIDSFDRRQTLS